MNDNIHSFLQQGPVSAHIMAHSSDTNLTLDQSQQTEADTSSASVGILGLLHQSPMNTDIMANSSEAELAHAQSKRTGEDTSATSAKSANVQEYEAPAVAAVLHTNELLHLIIAEVPREHRNSIRRVSKTWKAAVEKIGHVFAPEGHSLWKYHIQCWWPKSPLYPANVGFQFHPVLVEKEHIVVCTNTQGQRELHRSIANTFDRTELPKWAGLEREFDVSPPVTELLIRENNYEETIVQVSGGIRIGDLMDQINKAKGFLDSDICFATPEMDDDIASDTEVETCTSEDEDEEESEGSGESEDADDFEEEDADDGVQSSSESDRGSEQGDSKSGEDHQVEGSGTAADAVLHTNELLHLIIAEVPLQYRTSLRRVSKTWQSAVVKIGYTL
jgi:hypothetical protein